MSESHGVPESTPDKTADAQRTARKPDAEKRAFDTAAAPAARMPLTNLEAQGQAAQPGQGPFELADVWRDAFAPLLNAQMEANRWFDHLWRQTAGFLPMAPLRTARPFGALSMAPALGLPAADLRETDKAFQLAIELPGMSKDDIELKIEQDQICISGQKSEDFNESRGDYRVSERRFGRFERSFPIPADVRRDAIAASFADGVLRIDLPKSEPTQTDAKRIEIR